MIFTYWFYFRFIDLKDLCTYIKTSWCKSFIYPPLYTDGEPSNEKIDQRTKNTVDEIPVSHSTRLLNGKNDTILFYGY